MEMNQEELARKMKSRLARERDRQRRWREKQHRQGRRTITSMISRHAYETLQQERERTGERIADILDRAILGIVKSGVTNNVNIDAPVQTESMPAVAHDDDYVLAAIKRMRSDEGLPFNEIAHRLNDEGLPSPDGFAPWQGRQVYELFKKNEG